MTKPLVTTLIALMWCAGNAHADVQSDIYGDAKTIVEDLITKEVAETTVEEIACRAGHVPLKTNTNVPSVIAIPAKNPTEFYDLEALAYFSGTMRRLYAAQFGGLQATLVSEASDYVGFQTYLLLTSSPKSVDKTTLKVSNADATPLPDSLKRDAMAQFRLSNKPLSKTGDAQPTLEALNKDNYGPLSDGRHEECKSQVLAKLQAGLGTTPSRLDETCAADGADAFSCEIAYSVRAAAQGDTKTAQQHLLKAFASFVVGSSEISVSEIVSTITDPTDSSGSLDHVKALLASLNLVWAEYAPIIEELRMIVRSSTKLDMSQVRMLLKLGAEFCSTHANAAPCAAVKKFASEIKAQAMLDLLEAAMRGDIHETIHLAIETVLQVDRTSAPCDEVHNCTKSLYEKFFEALAYYVVDTAGSGASSDTRAAFRAAAEDVVRYQWPGGYQRGGYAGFRVRPDFALRSAWNQGNVSTTGSSYRTVAAIPVLLWRYPVYYTNMVYAGVHASALDLLSPLAELSLRPNAINGSQTQWSDESKVWINFLAPRIALELGIPALSNHLLLDVGAGLRMVVPYANGSSVDGAGNMVALYKYAALWDEGSMFSRSLELSLSVKYAP